MKKNVPYVLAFFFSLSIFLYPSPFSAQEVRLQIPIPELSPTVQACSGALCTGLAQYIIAFAKWLIAAISILAILFIMFGGLWWLTAAGSTKRIQFAKKLIWDSLMGLGLALGSVLLLGMINPDLVKFLGFGIASIQKVEFQLTSIEEDGSYDPSGDTIGKTGSAGTGGTTGGRPVAKNGTISMTLAESKTLRGIKLASSVVDSFDAAVQEIRKTHPEYKFVSGGGQSERGGTSCHNNGLSVDINPDQNPCGSDCLNYPGENCCWGKRGTKVGKEEFQPYKDNRSMTKEIVQIFQKHGWCWGGNWRSFRDLHHFSRCSKDCVDARPYQFPSH